MRAEQEEASLPTSHPPHTADGSERTLALALRHSRKRLAERTARAIRATRWLGAVMTVILTGTLCVYAYAAIFWPELTRQKTTPVEAEGMIIDMRTQVYCRASPNRCERDLYVLIGESAQGQCYTAYWPVGWPQPACPSLLWALENGDCTHINGYDRRLCEQLFRDAKRPGARLRQVRMALQVHNGHAIEGTALPEK